MREIVGDIVRGRAELLLRHALELVAERARELGARYEDVAVELAVELLSRVPRRRRAAALRRVEALLRS